MPYLITPQDERLEKQFVGLQLSSGCFDHRGHLQLAWIYNTRFELDEGLLKFRKDLQRFVTHVGAADKYEDTLTIKAYLLVHDRIKGSSASTFDEFMEAQADLMSDFKNLIKNYQIPENFLSTIV